MWVLQQKGRGVSDAARGKSVGVSDAAVCEVSMYQLFFILLTHYDPQTHFPPIHTYLLLGDQGQNSSGKLPNNTH